jgi:hypothetical protein
MRHRRQDRRQAMAEEKEAAKVSESEPVPMSGSQVKEMVLSYDLETGNFNLKAQGIPTIILLGMLELARGAVIENQMKQRAQAEALRAKLRL